MADFIFAVIITVFTLSGIKRGFVRTLLGVLSTLISLFLSNILYRPVSIAIANSALGDSLRIIAESFIQENRASGIPGVISGSAADALAQISANVLGFTSLLVIIKAVLSALSTVLNTAVRLPVIKQANKLLGGVLGFFGGALICCIIIAVTAWAAKAGLFTEFAKMIEDSYVASLFYKNIAA